MMIRLVRIAAVWLALLAPALASQATLVTPGSPLPMTSLASFLNSAFLSIGSCNSGPSAPANGTGAAAFAGECWINTTANPWVFNYTADGTHWSEFGTLNTSTFVWTPFGNGAAALISSNNLSDVANAGTSRTNLGLSSLYTIAGVTHQWVASVAAGVPTLTQPAIADISGWGTGVASALGVNIGSAGAPVLFNAALGTPSSGTVGTGVTLGGVTMGLGSDATGDIYYNSGGILTRLAKGSNGQALELVAGLPAWASVSGVGTVTSVTCDGVTFTSSGSCPPRFGFANCTIVGSVSGNNLTVALKDNAGADPTAASPCNVWFRSATANPASGVAQWIQRTVTAATSFTANAGSTFGISNTTGQCAAASSCPFRLHVVLIDTGSTAVLGIVALTNASGVLPLNMANNAFTSVVCSACTNATALGTIYSTVAQTNRPIVYLGYMDWGSGLGTAGTYASGPTLVQGMGPGVRLPGDEVQKQVSIGSNSVSSTSNAYGTGAPPANAPAVTITMQATPNLLRVEFASNIQTGNAASATVSCETFRGASGAVNTGIGPVGIINGNASSGTVLLTPVNLFTYDTPATLTPQIYTVRVKNSDNSTSVLCPASAGAPLEVKEIQGALPEIVPDNDNDPRLLNKAA